MDLSVQLASARSGGAGCGGSRWSRRAVLLAGLAIAGCGHQPAHPVIEQSDQPKAGDEMVVDALSGIAQRRAKAVLGQDESAFLADLDPSNTKLIKAQKMIFANLRQFGFHTLRFVTPATSVAPTRGVYRFPVVQITQLSIDEAIGGVAPAETFEYSLSKRGEKVTVTDIVAVTSSNAGQYRTDPNVFADAPWNTTPLTVVRAGHVWLAGDHTVPDLGRYAAAAQSEAKRVERLWGRRTRFPGYLLFFTRDDDNFRAWYGASASGNFGTDVEGFTFPREGVRANGDVYTDQYASARIVVNLSSTQVVSDDPALVMRHELAHAITTRAERVDASLDTLAIAAPNWAIEGFARWMETVDNPSRAASVRREVAAGVAAGKFHGVPPRSDEFYQRDVFFNYALGSTVFDFVEQAKGRDAAVEFYATVIRYPDVEDMPLVKHEVFNDICHRIMGTSSTAFLARWAGFVRGRG